MRIPVITINGSEPIDVTATVENGTKEYLSGKTVTGTALYVEQPDANGQGFLAMSLLIPKSGEMMLLKNNGFSESSAQWIIGKLSMLQDEIVEYVKEKVYDEKEASELCQAY